MTFNVLDIRKDFPCLDQKIYDNKPLIYLDNAATTQKPRLVIDAIARYYQSSNGNINRGAHFLSEQTSLSYQAARSYIAQFIGAEESDIIFTRSSTEAINLVASCLAKTQLKAGDEIILTEMEHHSNIVPWYLIAKEKNLTLKIAPILDDGTLDLEAFKRLFGPRTRLAAFAHASNVLGTINPIKDLVSIAQSHGVPTLIDGAQGLPHIDVDVKDLGADFYCFSGHKVYGPTGIGVLYMNEKWFDIFLPYQGGGDMVETVSFDNITFAHGPKKFEAGTPNIAGVLGLKKALEYIDTLGRADIHRYEQGLLDYAVLRMKDLKKVRLVGTAENKVSLISFVIDGLHPHDVSSIFDREGIAIRGGHLCAQPLMKRLSVNALSRVSFSFYNTRHEIDRLIEAFARVFEVFKL